MKPIQQGIGIPEREDSSLGTEFVRRKRALFREYSQCLTFSFVSSHARCVLASA
jgi:hypothetical protein